MASVIAVARKALYSAVSEKAKDTVENQSHGTSGEKAYPFVTDIMFSSIDLIVDAAVEGGVATPQMAANLILKRVVGISNLSEDDKVLCFTKLLDFALNLGATAAAAGTTAGGVLFPPAEAVSIPALIAASGSLAFSAVRMSQQCGPLVVKMFPKAPTEIELSRLRDERIWNMIDFDQRTLEKAGTVA